MWRYKIGGQANAGGPPVGRGPQSVFSLGLADGKEYFVDLGRRRHMSVVGLPGTGKTTLLLHLALQDVEAGRSVMIIDPAADLAGRLLSHLSSNFTRKLVVFSPMAFERFGLVPRINPLENASSRDLASTAFVRSLAEACPRIWRERFEGPLNEAIYSLWDRGEASVLRLDRELAARNVPSTARFPLQTCLSNRFTSSMLDCEWSDLDLLDAVRCGKVILAELPEAKLPPEAVRFVAGVLLSQVYLFSQRINAPLHIYIDDALRLPLRWHLEQALLPCRNPNLRITVALQNFADYPREIVEALLLHSNVQVAFAADRRDVAVIRRMFDFKFDLVVHQDRFMFYASLSSREDTLYGQREVVHLRVIDRGIGPADVNSIVKGSLQNIRERVIS